MVNTNLNKISLLMLPVLLVCCLIYLLFSNSEFQNRLFNSGVIGENKICLDDSFSNSASAGGFYEHGGYYSLELGEQLSDLTFSQITYWGSAIPGDSFTGSVITDFYSSDYDEVSFYIFGDFAHEGIRAYLEFENGETVSVPESTYTSQWYKWTVNIPNDLKFRFVAVDDDTEGWGWLAFSEPFNDQSVEIFNTVLWFFSIFPCV